MDETLLFLFGTAIFAFLIMGGVAYIHFTKQEQKKETRHYANWGN